MIGAPTRGRGPADPGERTSRSLLFLQGPISSFFDRLGRALIARGHQVHRVNLHFGDRLFWRQPAIDFRGRFDEWRAFVGDLMDQHLITDVLLHGDRRPYHIVAAEEARARGIAVIATDLGYVRPDWLTLEYDGMTTYSRFPKDPAAIRALAGEFAEPEPPLGVHTPFWLIASRDVVYNLAMAFGRPLFPHYRYHSVCHPFLEYAGWLRSRPKKLLALRATTAAKADLQSRPGSYFLVPLQLSTDFQIRAHSPYADLRDAVREIIPSFAASGSPRKLVFVVHPLDNGLIDWHRHIARQAREMGVADRVVALHGGTPTELLRNAAGVITVNSTVGITALCHGVPVKSLGNAVFDVAGLTCEGPLERFWQAPPRPDPELLADFLRALIGATQVRGGYYERRAQDCAIAGFVERLERRPYRLPPLTAADLAARAPRGFAQAVVVAGVSDAAGMALARSFAAPGVHLCLTGRSAEMLVRAADDCRQRGALAETVCSAGAAGATVAGRLAAFDRKSPVNLLVVHGEGTGDPERDVLAAMDIVGMLVAPMRRRRSGAIVLVSSLASHAMTGDQRGRSAWLAYAAGLRRRLRDDGIPLAVAAPSAIASLMAARLRDPALATASADRLADRVGRLQHRWRRHIAVPGFAESFRRALALWPSRAVEAVSGALLPGADAIAEAADEAPLAGKPASGD